MLIDHRQMSPGWNAMTIQVYRSHLTHQQVSDCLQMKPASHILLLLQHNSDSPGFHSYKYQQGNCTKETLSPSAQVKLWHPQTMHMSDVCLLADLSPLAVLNALIHCMQCKGKPGMQPAMRPARLARLSHHTPTTKESIHTRLLCYPPTAHTANGPLCEKMTSSTKDQKHTRYCTVITGGASYHHW